MIQRFMASVATKTGLIGLFMAGVVFAQAAQARAEFVIGDTQYIGNPSSGDGVDEYLGVPFAAPPIGDLRWQAPQDFTSSASSIEATQFAPACMQEDRIVKWYQSIITDFGGDPSTFPVPEFSEDCLHLNIWAPEQSGDASAEPWPVYVYIHGGSNKAGWSYEPNYIGRNLAQQGAVVVTVAYRVGVFGFFAHKDLEQVNFALLDQIKALSWIQDNIEVVGGDPENITVAGESAGADNIAVLLGSPLAKGLFKNAVIQSGGWSIVSMPTRDEVQGQTALLAENILGKADASLDDLREIDGKELAIAAEVAFAEFGFGPSVGDSVVPVALGDVAEQDRLHDVDVILGSNTNEFLIYLDPNQTVQQWLDSSPQHAEVAEEIVSLLDDGSSELEQVDKLITAVQFTCPTLKLAEQIGASGNNAYVYDFNMVRDGELGKKMGAYHGAEIPYIFATHDDWLPTTAADIELSDKIAGYWLAFMASGETRVNGQAVWPDFNESDRMAMSLGAKVGALAHPSIELCQLLQIID